MEQPDPDLGDSAVVGFKVVAVDFQEVRVVYQAVAAGLVVLLLLVAMK